MRRKTNAFLEALVKIMIIAFSIFIASMILLVICINTPLKDIFSTILFYSSMICVGLFFAFIFSLLVFADSQTSYTADLTDVPEEFENIYKILYEKHIVKLEEIKERIRKRTILRKVLLGIFILFLITQEIRVIFPLISLIIIGIGFGSFIGMLILYKNNRIDKKQYVELYKKEVIGNLINMINSQVIYEPENTSKIEQYKQHYIDARFFLNISEFNAEDFIEGMMDKCPMKISDVIVKRESGKYRIVFEGLFAYLDYDKYVMSDVVITRKFMFGNDANTKVAVNNDKFNKYFNVYSQNEYYAKRLLNDGLEKILVEFYEKYNIEFDISLIKSKLYIKIYSFSVFEPEIFDKTNGKQDLYAHYCFAKFILDLIKEVKIILDRN